MWKIYGAVLSAVVTVLAVCTFGYNLGKDVNQSLVSFLTAKNDDLGRENDNLRLENSSLKTRLAVTGDAASSKKDAVAQTPAHPAQDSAAQSTQEQHVQSARLNAGSTNLLFGGRLLIAMYGTKFEGDPLHNTFYGSVSIPGHKQSIISGVSPGARVDYENYHVYFLDISTFDAGVSVTEDSNNAQKN